MQRSRFSALLRRLKFSCCRGLRMPRQPRALRPGEGKRAVRVDKVKARKQILAGRTAACLRRFARLAPKRFAGRCVADARDAIAGVRAGPGSLKMETWLDSTWGRGAASTVLNSEAVAESSGTSERTVRRAQTVVSEALLSIQARRLREVREQLARDNRNGFVVIKRLWDETAIRLTLTVSERKALLPRFADQLVLNHGAGGRPTYTVQSLQQQGSIRWGVGADQFMMLLIPMALVPSTKASAIFLVWRHSGRFQRRRLHQSQSPCA